MFYEIYKFFLKYLLITYLPIIIASIIGLCILLLVIAAFIRKNKKSEIDEEKYQ